MTEPTTTQPVGLTSDLGLESVPDALPDATYSGYVVDLRVVNAKPPKTGRSLVFTYRNDAPGTPLDGERVDEFKSANPGDTTQQKRFLKQRLESLGIPESRMSSLTKEDVVGKAVFFTMKTNGQYHNVSKVELRSPENQQAVANYEQQGNTQAPPTSSDIADLV